MTPVLEQSPPNPIMTSNPFHLPVLSHFRREKLLQWAQQVLTAQHHIQILSGSSILHQTLNELPRHQSMRHYPLGDRIDYQQGGQYFYHCHRENFTTTEHGHFHCFLRQAAIPKHIRRKPGLNWQPKSAMTHLVAIGMDKLGQPIRLFTVNRWVTDESWYDACHVNNLVKRFKLSLNDSSSWQLIDQWVEGMVHLFTPHILWLHQQRDLLMSQHQASVDRNSHYEDRNIEELSSLTINLPAYIQWIINASPRSTQLTPKKSICCDVKTTIDNNPKKTKYF